MRKVVGVFINEVYCKGCGICIYICPRDVLELSPEFSERGVHPVSVKALEKCSGCKLCEVYCPDFAIAVDGGDEVAS